MAEMTGTDTVAAPGALAALSAPAVASLETVQEDRAATLTLHTALLGDLHVPNGGAARNGAAEL